MPMESSSFWVTLSPTWKPLIEIADWYCQNLGFHQTDDLEVRGEPGGPILITADEGVTSISIFSRDRPIQNIFPAFGCKIDEFLRLNEKFDNPTIYDHFRFFSFYIRDSDQNKIEICITDYEIARSTLDRLSIKYLFMTPETYTP